MIQPLRTSHRVTFLLLAILLPVLFLSGLASRRTLPGATAPSEIRAAALVIVSQQFVSIRGTKLEVRVVGNPSGQNERELQLLPAGPIVAPDVLVYWTEVESESSIPGDARFLGTFRSDARYSLPASHRGYILLYSLAQKEVLAEAFLGARP